MEKKAIDSSFSLKIKAVRPTLPEGRRDFTDLQYNYYWREKSAEKNLSSGLLTLCLATVLWGCSGSNSPAGPVAEQPLTEPATKNPRDFQVQTVYDQ